MPIGSDTIALQKETISSNLGHWRDSSDASVNTATTTAHGTDGVVTQRLRAIAAGTTQVIPAWGTAPVSEGWRVDVAELGTTGQTRRFLSGTWTFTFRLGASTAQIAADTAITVRVFAGVPGSMTERFRKSAAFAVAAQAILPTNCAVVCDSSSIVASGGVTGTPPQIDLLATESIQIEVYLAAPGVAVVGQTLTLSLEAAALTAATTSRVVLPNVPVILETGDTSNAVAPTGADAIADTQTNTAVAAYTFADALAEIRNLTVVSSLALALEALIDVGGFASVVVPAQRETIVDPPGDVTTAVALTQLEALAEIGGLTTAALLDALEALAEAGVLTAVTMPTGAWQLISPGLSGIVYDASGSSIQSGAQVLLFDDTNALIATLTSDAAGLWAVDLDPAFTYWISGWKDTPEIEDRTDRALVPVETVIATGT